MNYRQLGDTGIYLSEIGLGGEWLERHTTEECKGIIDACAEKGINVLDCWMSNPAVRSNIGNAIRGQREKWHIQGHIGSTWQDGQYVRSRELGAVKAAFQDLLDRLETDYIDLGMIHFVDAKQDFEELMRGDFIEYVRQLKRDGVIRQIGMSTHNPDVAKMAAMTGEIKLILFSVNPAFDMLPATEDIDTYFADDYDSTLSGIAPERAELYSLCEQNGVGITVMKGYAGGRLLNAQSSPFGVALTPVQCLHYALTRPAVTSVMVGINSIDQVDAAVEYESATDEQKDYATTLAGAPRHAYSGQCTYCGHCKPCPAGIDIALVNKYVDLATMQKDMPPTLRAHYAALDVNASACIACGGCETRCPFGVRVIEKMEKAQALFG